jgi:hypothetical protein
MFPETYVYPRKMRSTRDLLRRRNHLAKKRAELMAHVQNKLTQYHLPKIGSPLKNKSARDATKNISKDKSVQKTIDLDVGLIAYYQKELNQ